MAKDPAFLFYYDRFLSGTISMSDSEVGQYIRLMCIQANKGHITKKDMLHICKTSDNEVCLKFAPLGDDKFANSILTEVLNQRKNFTESRRNNRKGKKQELVNNTSETHEKHVVNVNVNVNKDVIDNLLKESFDENYFASIEMTYRSKDIKQEFDYFSQKVRGSPKDYEHRDTGKIRMAFEYQLRNAKDKQHVRGSNKTTSTGVITDFSDANYKTKL